jgi:hypothetical protein
VLKQPDKQKPTNQDFPRFQSADVTFAAVSARTLCSVWRIRLTSACDITVGPFSFGQKMKSRESVAE